MTSAAAPLGESECLKVRLEAQKGVEALDWVREEIRPSLEEGVSHHSRRPAEVFLPRLANYERVGRQSPAAVIVAVEAPDLRS